MPPNNDNTVLMEGVRIVFRNFKGAAGRFNREGDRNFAVLLDDAVAERMLKDGWNIKRLRPLEDAEEGSEGQAYIGVTVNFRGRPPAIYMITSRGRTRLDEEQVEILDWADIINVDLIVRPYEWDVSGKTGVKAYLKSLYVTIQEDELERKYGDLDHIPARAGRTVGEE